MRTRHRDLVPKHSGNNIKPVSPVRGENQRVPARSGKKKSKDAAKETNEAKIGTKDRKERMKG